MLKEVMLQRRKDELTPSDWRWLKRRQAVEPTIGHLKAEHRMRRCHLKGQLGDALNAVLAAAGYNLPWLMRWLLLFCAWILASMMSRSDGQGGETPLLAA